MAIPGVNPLNQKQRQGFQAIRQAYQPIKAGSPTYAQNQAFNTARASNPNVLDRRIGNVTAKIRNMRQSGGDPNRIAALKNRRQNLKGMSAYAGEVADPNTVNPLPLDNSAQQQADDYMKLLLPNTSGEPAKVGDTALYNWQLQQGQKGLDRLMAARGFTGSGREIQANSEFLSNLAANEASIQRDIGQKVADRDQNQANRAWQMMYGTAGLGLQDKQQSWGNMNNTLGTMLSTNAFGQGANAAGQQANLGAQYGTNAANLAKQAYSTPGPTGGGGFPSFMAPYPNAPDYSGADSFGAGAGGAGASSNWSNWAGLLGSLWQNFGKG